MSDYKKRDLDVDKIYQSRALIEGMTKSYDLVFQIFYFLSQIF